MSCKNDDMVLNFRENTLEFKLKKYRNPLNKKAAPGVRFSLKRGALDHVFQQLTKNAGGGCTLG